MTKSFTQLENIAESKIQSQRVQIGLRMEAECKLFAQEILLAKIPTITTIKLSDTNNYDNTKSLYFECCPESGTELFAIFNVVNNLHLVTENFEKPKLFINAQLGFDNTTPNWDTRIFVPYIYGNGYEAKSELDLMRCVFDKTVENVQSISNQIDYKITKLHKKIALLEDNLIHCRRAKDSETEQLKKAEELINKVVEIVTTTF